MISSHIVSFADPEALGAAQRLVEEVMFTRTLPCIDAALLGRHLFDFVPQHPFVAKWIELDLGNIVLMLSEEFPEYGCRAPQAPGSTGMVIHLHCDNADELAARAIAAGATMVREPSDAFYGERSCTIRERL